MTTLEPADRFDVQIQSVPAATPSGAPFVEALAAAFAVEVDVAERIVREAPVTVKRGVPKPVAERLRAVLESLGAGVAVVPVLSERGSFEIAVPVGVAPGPRILPPGTVSLRPPPTLPPPPAAFSISPRLMVLGAVVLVGLLWVVFARWLKTTGDEQMLGNTPSQETTCTGNYCLAGSGLDRAPTAKHVLVVAWREGCLDPDFEDFLAELAAHHPAAIEVLAAGLAVPASRDRRALGKVPLPPPDPWPPAECSGTKLRVLPVENGYASDLLAPPVTYLTDASGHLVAVWRGAMSPNQRARLTSWVEGRPWVDPDR